MREIFDASLELDKEALKAVGMHPFKVEKMSQVLRRHDQIGIDSRYELPDENIEVSSNQACLSCAREHRATLTNLMETDRVQLYDRSERGWTPPPKHLAEHADD